MILARVAAAALASFVTASAGAEEPRPRDPLQLDALARGGLVTDSSFFAAVGPLVGFAAQYRVSPYLRAGVYFEYLSNHSTSSDHDALVDALRFGARVEGHVLPHAVVDPWIGASFGAFRATNHQYPVEPFSKTGADLGAELGVDVHVTDHVALGLEAAVIVPLGGIDAFGGKRTGGGTTYSGTFDFPLPLLRVVVSL